MKKFLMLMALAGAIFVTVTEVMANELEDSSDEYTSAVYSEAGNKWQDLCKAEIARIEAEHAQQLEVYLNELTASNNPRARWQGEGRAVLENSRRTWTPFARASNQNPGGFNHGVGGGAIHYSDIGGGNVSLSLGFSWVGFGGSVSVPRGRVGAIGHTVTVPSNLRNRFVLLYIQREVSVRTYRIYSRTTANGPWIFQGRRTTTATIRPNAEVRLAR